MAIRAEDYWLDLQSRWLTKAFPFERPIFERIKTDILYNQYTSAEAILKHLNPDDPPTFTAKIIARYGELPPENLAEFFHGYQALQMLCQVAFIAVAHGFDAAEESLRQNPNPYNEFIRDNLQRAASLVHQDISGRKMMTTYGNDLSQTSQRYANEGVLTSMDTFMGYSKTWEEHTKGNIEMSEPIDITGAVNEVRPLIENLMRAQDRMQTVMGLGTLTDFLSQGSREHTHAYCVESWQAGRAIFNAAMQNGITDVAAFPDIIRLKVSIIATLWTQEFKNHPKDASEGLLYAETQLWRKGDRVADWWVLWLRAALKHGLGKDVDEIMKQHLKRR